MVWLLYCSTETTVSQQQVPIQCKYLCQDLIRQIGRPGWKRGKWWKKTLLQISYKMVLSYLVSKCLLPPPHLTVTLPGGLDYANKWSALTHSLFRQSLNGSVPQQEMGRDLKDFTHATWNSKRDLATEQFAADSSLSRDLSSASLCFASFFLFRPRFIPFFFPILLSLSLLHIISLQRLPDCEEKVIIL